MENTNNLEEKIKQIFSAADLSLEDQNLWASKLSVSEESIQRIFISVFENDLEMLRFFTRDLRDRTEAGSDPAKLASALENEREYLRAFLKKSKTN